MAIDIETAARRLDAAWQTRQPIAPLRNEPGVRDAAEAYAIQQRWLDVQLARGDRIIGRKIGLTSKAVQEQLGVGEPDYGGLLASRFFAAHGGRADIPAECFLQPRIEGELAFLIGRPLREPGVTLQQALAATEAVAPAFEVVDSRIAGWDISLVDTVADNASFGAFTLGAWSRDLRHADLRTLGMLVSWNGRPAVQGVGAAALGHPARAVAWLANTLLRFGTSLEPGDIVLSGALAPTVSVRPGDSCTLELAGQPALHVRFS